MEQELALEFSKILKAWLTENNSQDWDNMIESHIAGEYHKKNVCVSHDFCDPNQAMIDAFKSITGKEPELVKNDDSNEGDISMEMEIINRAWDIAKQNNFFHEQLK